ncbi:MAG: hypothetical protein LBS56_06255, partial [Propionibacteriaceae bacterium]|nr:hypothetical protein [Propionibacteriaceae bacterium]
MWLVVVLLLVTAWSIRRDARKLRCGVYLLSVIVALGLAAVVEITASLSQLDHRAGVVFLMAGLVIVLGAVVVLGVALVLNGFQMVRREGHRLQNLLSLLVGLAILGFVAVGAGVVATARVDLIAWFFTGALPVGYLAYGFTAYLLYSLVYRAGVRRWAPPPEAVVVLGAGLVRGRVPPLLASRLDKGQEMLGRAREATPGAIIVASGGQG